MNTVINIYAFKIPIWLRWFIATVIAAAVALAIMILFAGRLINNFPPLYFGLTIGALFGGCTGIAQSIILKNYMRRYKIWAITTTIGWMIFWSLNMAGYFGQGRSLDEKISEGIIHGLLFGLMCSLLQSLCFSSRHVSFKWILYSSLTWSCCAAIADGLKAIINWQGPAEFIIALPTTALLSGIIMQPVLNKSFMYTKNIH